MLKILKKILPVAVFTASTLSAQTTETFTIYPLNYSLSAQASLLFCQGQGGVWDAHLSVNQRLYFVAEPNVTYNVTVYNQSTWSGSPPSAPQVVDTFTATGNHVTVDFYNPISEYFGFYGACQGGPNSTEILYQNPNSWRYAVVTKTYDVPPPSGPIATIKTKAKSKYLVAENGGPGQGGGTVNANRDVPYGWETFTIVDKNGGALNSGDKINIASEGYYYVVAESGGGSAVNANRINAAAYEEFTVYKVSSTGAILSGQITSNSYIAIKTHNNLHYFSAEGGGGAGLNANQTSIGQNEIFIINLY